MVDFFTPQADVETSVTTSSVLDVTPAAAATVRTLLEQRQIPNHVLRVFVQGGGCSGMQYGMTFEADAESYDTVISVDGVRLVVDPTSLEYLRGATIDFVDSLMGGGFRIDNPNAVSSCGCGHSFKSSNSDGSGSDGGCSTCGSH
ncbi:MAG: iron-sulfur cluster insertion protein ErpA [Chloroflexi bacterium]|nr:iron-sulfur cluster insertion protein ErpA [Chloroflexota bacterium]